MQLATIWCQERAAGQPPLIRVLWELAESDATPMDRTTSFSTLAWCVWQRCRPTFLELAVIAPEGLDLGGLRLAVYLVTPITKSNVVYITQRDHPLIITNPGSTDLQCHRSILPSNPLSRTLPSAGDTHIS
jgi:hypothetical protein